MPTPIWPIEGVALDSTGDLIEGSLGALMQGGARHTPQAVGDVWYVSPSGNDGNSGETPDVAFLTIAVAIAAASAGDVIKVESGTYTEDIDMNLVGLELWGEIGATLVGTLTVSVNSCRVVEMLIAPAAAVGLVLNGSYCKVQDVFVVGTPTTAVDINAGNNIISHCMAVGYTVTAFDVAAGMVHLYQCTAAGADTATRGFYLSTNAADTCLLENCVSMGNTTAGYHIVTGVNNVTLLNCSTGSGDGRWIDADGSSVFADFHYDNVLHKDITISGDLSYNLFQVTGTVRINFIYASVAVVLPAAVTAARLELFPTGGAAIDLTLAAGVDISAAPVGSFIAKTGTAASALVLGDSTLGFLTEATGFVLAPFVVGQKTGGVDTFIRLTRAGAGASGQLHWHIEWEPLSDDGFVEVV